ncbi:MAG: ribbon-helix-helix protein, CopG family [Nitrospinae bacterium]|nr:ribbon-helix-helix protein, CopG family [Nitrospinota bacterium]
MSTLSVRLPDDLLKQADARARELRLSRAEYIRKAVENLNKEIAARKRKDRLTRASHKVRGESMAVNAEFAGFEDDGPF